MHSASPGKPDFKQVPPQTTQIFDLKRPAYTIYFSILNLSHSLLHTTASNWTGDKWSQIIKLSKKLLAFRLLLQLQSEV